MFRNFFLTLSVIALTIEAQEIPDYKGDYTFTNSKFSMDGVRELITDDNGVRVLKFNAKFAMGKINIQSNFMEKNGKLIPEKYSVGVRWTVFKDNRTLSFDSKKNEVTASGKFEWTQKLPENGTVFDPLNVQIEIRKNVINNVQEFSMLMPDLKTGVIEKNNYRLIEDGTFEVAGKIYLCKVVERVRTQDDRTTRYFLAKELNHLIIKVEDQDTDGDTMLEMTKLY